MGGGRYAPGGFLDNWQIFLYNNIIKKTSMSAHGRIAAHGRACRGSDLLRAFLYSGQGTGLKVVEGMTTGQRTALCPLWRLNMAKGYSIPVGMLWKKMYCFRCGTMLNKKKKVDTYQRGEPGFQTVLVGGRINLSSSFSHATYTYVCPNCCSEISYDDQLDVESAQKELGKKILSIEEIPNRKVSRAKLSRLVHCCVWILSILAIIVLVWLKYA